MNGCVIKIAQAMKCNPANVSTDRSSSCPIQAGFVGVALLYNYGHGNIQSFASEN
ncbi:MAG: hypothetical protein ANABAC_1678 [Anaerolineae bacterium]|nr:MAG: hypothetical protein ANABAC_1678 [Anaerolineae bacterium]